VKVQFWLFAPNTEVSLRYHWKEYGVVPPVIIELNVWDCPRYILTWTGEIVTLAEDSTIMVALFD